MSDSKRIIRTLLLLSPLLLSGCDTLDHLASLKLPSIDFPWDSKPAPTAVALRQDASDTAPAPDGMQRDDLRAPFGDTPSAVTAANAP
ncbi:MAG TPA: hypothetical protein VHU87_10450 [Rhizomicrobium sp.]|jgi:hypothetical protein|nr:hypothetical protein [Rhizomicrobium sp.]